MPATHERVFLRDAGEDRPWCLNEGDSTEFSREDAAELMEYYEDNLKHEDHRFEVYVSDTGPLSAIYQVSELVRI